MESLTGFMGGLVDNLVLKENYSHSVMSNSVALWTVDCQAPLFSRFSKQEYWSGFPFPSPGDLPDPGIELGPPTLQSDSLWSEPQNIIQQQNSPTPGS